MKKKIIVLLFLDALFGGFLFAQANTVVTCMPPDKNGSTGAPISSDVFPYLALANSDHGGMMCGVYKEQATVTAVTLIGDGTAVLTVNNDIVVHTPEAPVIRLYGMTSALAPNSNLYGVISATPTTVTIGHVCCGPSGPLAETGTMQVMSDDSGWTGRVTWSVANAVGGGTYKIQTEEAQTSYTATPTLSNQVPLTHVLIDGTPGNCSRVVSGVNQSFDSTRKFDLVATSVDNPAKSDHHHFIVCADDTIVYPKPAYLQVWQGVTSPLNAQMVGQADLYVDWTIISHPSYSGCTAGTISNANLPLAIFNTGTCTGQYKIQASSHEYPGKNFYLVRYVATTGPPSYYNNPPDKAEPMPCEIDPALTGNHYEYGIGKANGADLTAYAGNNYPAGSTFRFWNTDTTGTNPDVFHYYIQTQTPTSGTVSPENPAFYACNVPDATGHHAIFDGQGAHGASWVDIYTGAGAGIISVTGDSRGYGPLYHGLLPLRYWAEVNFTVRNADLDNTYFAPDGSSQSYGQGSSCMREWSSQGGTYWGNSLSHCTQGIFNDFNGQNSGWGGFVGDTTFGRNYLTGMGTGAQTEHTFYVQGWRMLLFGNHTDGLKDGGQGNAFFSSRSAALLALYNRVDPDNTTNHRTGASETGLSETQDATTFILTRQYYGDPDIATTCAALGFSGCLGDGWGINGLAALQESHNVTGIIGMNIFRTYSGGKPFEYTTTHATVGMENPMQIYWYYNTFYLSTDAGANSQAMFEWWRTDNWHSPLDTPVQWNWGYIANNIIDMPANNPSASGYSYVINQTANSNQRFQTNLLDSLWGTTTIPLHTAYYNQYQYPNGLGTGRNVIDAFNQDPMNLHLGGFVPANFVTYTAQPIDIITMKAINGQAAVGAASALIGPAAAYPPLWNAVEADGSMTLRTDATTVGATDPVGAGPTPVSIAILPNPINLPTGGTQALTCTTTLSDSSTRSCFSPACTSNNTASATVSGLTVTATATPGTGTISCTAESLSAPGDAFTVTGTPTPGTGVSGTMTISGGMVIR